MQKPDLFYLPKMYFFLIPLYYLIKIYKNDTYKKKLYHQSMNSTYLIYTQIFSRRLPIENKQPFGNRFAAEWNDVRHQDCLFNLMCTLFIALKCTAPYSIRSRSIAIPHSQYTCMNREVEKGISTSQ